MKTWGTLLKKLLSIFKMMKYTQKEPLETGEMDAWSDSLSDH